MAGKIAINPVLTFKTAMGSQYWMDKRGRCQRYKSYHPEHGYSDQGWQDVYRYVIFVDNHDASQLVSATVNHFHWKLFLRRRQVGILSLDRGQRYKFVAGPFIFSDKPLAGFAPIEFQKTEYVSGIKGYFVRGSVHVGNEIVTVKYLENH